MESVSFYQSNNSFLLPPFSRLVYIWLAENGHMAALGYKEIWDVSRDIPDLLWYCDSTYDFFDLLMVQKQYVFSI